MRDVTFQDVIRHSSLYVTGGCSIETALAIIRRLTPSEQREFQTKRTCLSRIVSLNLTALRLTCAHTYIKNCTSLAFLYLSHNDILNVWKISLPPSILRLDLRHNKLDNLGNYDYWGLVPHLRSLHLDDNNLSLAAFEALSPLSNLVILTCNNNPALKNPLFRHYIVNLLPSLQFLNGSIISLAERVSYAQVSDYLLQKLSVNIQFMESYPSPLPLNTASREQLRKCYTHYCGTIYDSEKPIKDLVDPFAFDAYNIEILTNDLRTIASMYGRLCPIVTIQRICKGFIVRAKCKSIMSSRSTAATKIQAFYRMTKVYTRYASKIKSRVLTIKHAAITIQRHSRYIVEERHKKQSNQNVCQRERAAIVIARAYRKAVKIRSKHNSIDYISQPDNELRYLRLYIAKTGDSYSNLITIFEQLIQLILSELQISIFAYPDAHPEELTAHTGSQKGFFFSVTITPYQLLKASPSISTKTGEVFDVSIRKRGFKTFASAYSIINANPLEPQEETLQGKILARATSSVTNDLQNSLYQRVMRNLKSTFIPDSTKQAHWEAADCTDTPFILRYDFRLYCISSLFRYLLSEFQFVNFVSFYSEDITDDIEKSIDVGKTIATKHLSHNLYQELVSLVTTGCFSNNTNIPSYRKRRKEKQSFIVIFTEQSLVQTSAACSIQSLFRMWRSNMILTPLELFGRHVGESNINNCRKQLYSDQSRRNSIFANASANLVAALNKKQSDNVESRSNSRLSAFVSAPSIEELQMRFNDYNDETSSLSSTLNTSRLSEPMVNLRDVQYSINESMRVSEYYSQDIKSTASEPILYQTDSTLTPLHHIAQTKSIESDQCIYSNAPVYMHPYPIIRLAIRVSRASQIIQRNFRRILARMKLLVTLKARNVFVETVKHGFFLISRTVADHLFDNCLLNPKSTYKLPHVTSYLGEHSYITLLPPLSEKFKQHLQQLDTPRSNTSSTKSQLDNKEDLLIQKKKRAEVLAGAYEWSLSTDWVFRGYYGSDIITAIGFEYQIDSTSLQTKQTSEAVIRRPKSTLERRSTKLNINVLQNLNYNRIFGHPFLKQWGAIEVYSSKCYMNSILSADSLYQHYLRSFPPETQADVSQNIKGVSYIEHTYKQSDFNFFALPMVAGETKKTSRSISAQIVRGLRSISSLAIGINDDDNSGGQCEIVLDCEPFRTFCTDSRLSYFPRKECDGPMVEDIIPYIRYNTKATLINNLRIIKEGLVFSAPSKDLFSTTICDDFQYVTGGLYCVTHRPGCSIPDLAFKAALLEIWFCNPFRYNYSTTSLSTMCRTFLGSPGIVLTPKSVITTLAALSIQRIMRGHLVRKHFNINRNIHALVKLQDCVDVPIRNAFREKYAIQMIKSVAEEPKKPLGVIRIGQSHEQHGHILSTSALPPTPRKITPRGIASNLIYFQPAQIRTKPKLSYNVSDIMLEGRRVGVLPLILKSNMHPIDVCTDIDSKTYSLDALDVYAKTGKNPATNEARLTEAFYKASKELGHTMNTRTNKLVVAGVQEAKLLDMRPIQNTRKATLLLNELRDLTTKQIAPMLVHDKLRLRDYYRNKIMLPVELHQFVTQHAIKLGCNSRYPSRSNTSSIHRDIESTSSNSSMVLGGTTKELAALNREIERFSLEEDRITEQQNDDELSNTRSNDVIRIDHCSLSKSQSEHFCAQFTEAEELLIQTQLRRTILEKGAAVAKEYCTRHKISLANEINDYSFKLKAEAETCRDYYQVEQAKLKAKVQNSKTIAKCNTVGKHLAGDLVARMRKLDSVLRSDYPSTKDILDS